MPIEQILAKLERRYPRLERVADAVFRCFDEYEGRPYAIRYFDLTDDLLSAAERLHEYQDKLLGASYFNDASKADLRWNHYLYFLTSATQPKQDLARAKAVLESDREYARKLVVTENDLDQILQAIHFGSDPSVGLPADPLAIWTDTLEKHDLAFIVDETLQVPTIVQYIADGERRTVLRAPARPQLDLAEQAVTTDVIASLAIREFRQYPVRKSFEFGRVNLILGVNGVGKTSLLEAIEYLICGRTKRAGAVLPNTKVSGVLAKSNLTLETKNTTSQATLRSRHLVWYGKSELRTLTLHDSFSKFNFLDTDAAVRLSIEESRERIIDDLAQLLLGAEASKVNDRLERVIRQLTESQKKLETDIAIRDVRRSEATARLQLLHDTPHHSDPLFKDLLYALRDAGWRPLPNDKSQVDPLSTLLQSTLVNLAVLRRGNNALPIDLAELDAAIQTLNGAERTVEQLRKEEIVRKRDDAQARQRLQRLSGRLEALDSLAPPVAAGVNDLHRRSQVLERQLSERTSSLAEAEAAAAKVPSDKTMRRQMLSQIVADWTEAVRVADGRINSAKKGLAALERTQSLLSALRQRLQANARELIQHTGDRTHCPLCRAEYSTAELSKRVEQVAHGLVTDESERLLSELRNAESLHQERVSELTALRTLERLTKRNPTKTSLEATIGLISGEREQIAVLRSELETARSSLRMEEEKGWTFERLMEIASNAGIPEAELSSDGIDSARVSSREEQKRLLETINRLEAEARDAWSRLVEISATFAIEKPSPTEVKRVVSETRRLYEDRRIAIAALGEQVTLSAMRSTSELDARLREAQELVVRLRTAVSKEKQDSDVLQRESKLVADAVAEIDGLRVKLRRVDGAITVLEELLGQQSERILAETVLRENAASIASTFAKIHAPNEFDLVVNGGLSIVRRGGGSVELNEMSSGQRAAYALSLFLAMNERLTTGPKVLLFDDPVAHVDDINTLSLLDHLRDIALTGQRQIFFATADSKIGALFGRKFRFLGEQFKQIELTRE